MINSKSSHESVKPASSSVAWSHSIIIHSMILYTRPLHSSRSCRPLWSMLRITATRLLLWKCILHHAPPGQSSTTFKSQLCEFSFFREFLLIFGYPFTPFGFTAPFPPVTPSTSYFTSYFLHRLLSSLVASFANCFLHQQLLPLQPSSSAGLSSGLCSIAVESLLVQTKYRLLHFL